MPWLPRSVAERVHRCSATLSRKFPEMAINLQSLKPMRTSAQIS
jgi:hypothetical protein